MWLVVVGIKMKCTPAKYHVAPSLYLMGATTLNLSLATANP